MLNKKSKFLFCISCLLLLTAIGVFFGFHFQPQPGYAATNETSISKIAQQVSNPISANDIFENYTQTSLKDEYRDKSILEQLKTNEQITQEQYIRAIKVLDGDVKFTQRREFSTSFDNDNKIDQVGDIAAYSQTELKCIWKASEIILTGIYGMQEETFNIFVEANESDKLPSILFTQNHGYYTHWYEERQLKKGWNIIEFPSFGRGLVAKDEIWGGAVYLCNPYFPDEQGEVKVYIEGGGYYPVFRKGGNEKEFLNFLKEYENERKTKNLLNMAELVTDHAIISTTSSSLYEVYCENDVITPTENLNLWGNYFTQLFEFNGIPTSEKSNVGRPYDNRNDYVKINFRYMTVYEGSGAYSYSYHIGWYYEHYWFANFYNAKHPLQNHDLSNHLLFGIGHELGHALDNEPRKINETTNNFTAAMAFFNIVGMPHVEQYQPFEKTLTALSNDYTLDYSAYDDGQIMYTKAAYKTNYDHNYLIWWDLEAVFPGFWARFNNYFRQPVKAGLSKEELYVYYSSLATGVDLSNYYERWGFYYGKPSNVSGRFIAANASKAFKDAMQEATTNKQISKQYDHFWYVDGAQYNFMLAHENVAQEDREYKNGKPTITKISKSNNQHTIFINSNKHDYHLGYEVFSKVNNENWKLVGFTYTSSFVDKNYYSSTPSYKVQAVNRFFKTSIESEPVSNVTIESPYVCRVNNTFYNDLSTAISQAEANSTVYLLNDCSIKEKYIVKNIILQIDETVNNDIYIYNKGATSTFVVQSNFSIIGKDNAKIIFDGGDSGSGNPAIYATNGKTIIKNAIFSNFNTTFLAGAVYSTDADLEIYNTSFDSCNSSKDDAAIYASKRLKLENCNFSNNFLDVYIKNLGNFTLSNQYSKFGLGFDKFEDEKTVSVEGNASEILKQIDLKVDGYMTVISDNQIIVKPLSFKLKFNYNTPFEYSINDVKFVFGDEFTYNLQKNQYVEYEECVTGKKYKTGDKIVVEKDMEFNVKIKAKLSLKILYNNDQSLNYYPYGEEIYLPTIDKLQNKVFAYKDGDRIYSAGQIYTLTSDSALIAIYLGTLTYRYIVHNNIYSVGYGNYGQSINLLNLEEVGFLGWQYGGEIVNGNIQLKEDANFIAVFSGDLPEIYDLEQCEIQISGTYTYSGEQIVPNILVYFNKLIVPSRCYTVSCSNNIFASKEAQITISFVQGLSTGSKTQTFTILPKHLVKNDVQVIGLKNFVYNGSQTAQNLTITYQNQAIETFSVFYEGDRINAGNVQIKITFLGNYSGTINLEYTILKADRDGFSVSLSNWVYGENAPNPTVEGNIDNAQITYSYSTSRDGSYSAKIPTNAGTYWIKAQMEQSQNYNSAEAIASFTIEKAENPPKMPEKSITISRKAKTLQDVSLRAEGWQWVTPNSRIAGETMTALAEYSDKVNYKNYQIQITLTKEPRKNVSSLSVNLDIKNFVYDGTVKTPKVIAKDGEFVLILSVDYDVEYKNNKLAGQGKAIVTFKNDYIGTKELTFTISKAEQPTVDTTIYVKQSATKLSDIQLPDGFVWENENLEISAAKIKAKAIYKGADADCYKTKEIYFEIIFEEQDKPLSGGLIAAIILTPIAISIVVFVVYAIKRRRRNSWWNRG